MEMQVPGCTNAVIEDAKLLEYALNPEHPQGAPKARFFEGIGYTRDDHLEIQQTILEALPDVEGSYSRDTHGCQLWTAIIAIRRRDVDGIAEIVTVWEVADERPTRLVTLYPN